MLIIGIDTSGKTASCALCEDERVLAQSTLATARAHSQVILPMVKRLLTDSGRDISEVDGYAVVTGPGSYTGIRIGIGAVKGLCMGSGKVCAGVSALEAAARNFAGSESTVCACMHARQELYYGALFRTHTDGSVDRLSPDMLIPLAELADKTVRLAESVPVICAGDGSAALTEAAGCGNVKAAPVYLNSPDPVGVVMSGIAAGFHSHEELTAEYMSVTKAEKELEGKGISTDNCTQ